MWDAINKDLFAYYVYRSMFLNLERTYYQLHFSARRYQDQSSLNEMLLLQEAASECRDQLRLTCFEGIVQNHIRLLHNLEPLTLPARDTISKMLLSYDNTLIKTVPCVFNEIDHALFQQSLQWIQEGLPHLIKFKGPYS